MHQPKQVSRREALTAMAGAAGAAVAVAAATPRVAQAVELKGRVKHSACRWCYQKTPLEELCEKAKAAGVQSIELLKEDEWPIVQAQGLECAVAYGPTAIARGWNDPSFQDEFVKEAQRLLPIIAAAGIPNMICFSGLRRKVDDAAGLKNCAEGLKRITPTAEKAGVTVIMELLNSRRDHPYYQCDRTAWGKALVDEVGSDRFKLLYDIYHMQIMEGDVVATIQEHKDYIAHYHTAGVPGRNEIDETQELYYPRIIDAIYETGYTGYVGQEFIPTWEDPFAALAAAVQICDV
jgi:hydroxypyruvate isomerase